MRIERHVDCGRLYDQARRDLLDLVRSITPDQLGRVVAATPDWTVHDVVSHLVGICADLNAQNITPASGEEWTAAQVRQRRDRSIDELAAEWDREAPTFIGGLDLFGYDMGSHYLGDLLQHVADVHATLGLGPLPGDERLVVALDFYLSSFDDTLVEAGVGGVRVRLPDEDWVLGPLPVVATLTASPFELFRALGGRRSLEQLRGLDWEGDVDAVVPLVSRYPVPTAPILDDA